jgi:hypothetical protein
VPHALIFFNHDKELPAVHEVSPTSILKGYEFYNSTTMSIIELQFIQNKWNLKKHTENLRNCISINQSHTGSYSGWNFEFTLPRLFSLESEHYFILTDLKQNFRYFENKDTCKIFSIGNFETPAIAWESLNEFSFEDYDSSLIEGIVSYYKLQDFKPYKKTETIKFFLDKGILHAEITQDGSIYDPENGKMIPQNAKTYYRYSEEKKIFTKLE